MLDYAAQGLPSDEGRQSGKQIREFQQNAVDALSGIAEACEAGLTGEDPEGAEKHLAFIGMLDRDARNSVAAIEFVLMQPVISSQLINNLNAPIHLRAVLTDLFLIGDIVRQRLGRVMFANAADPNRASCSSASDGSSF